MEKSTFIPIEDKMNKTIAVLTDDFRAIRAGKANPAILEKITVDYYGVPTKINQLANVSVPEARMIVIQPWDASIFKEVEKAIQMSDIGINPNNDGTSIRLIFPELTEERRKDIVKTIKKKGEDAKVSLRSIRRDAMDDFKNQKKDSIITEDDLKYAEEEVQKITDRFVKEVDDIVNKKEEEILKV